MKRFIAKRGRVTISKIKRPVPVKVVKPKSKKRINYSRQRFDIMNPVRYNRVVITRSITDQSLFTQGAAQANYSGAITFALNTVPNVTEFQAIFNKYRILSATLNVCFTDTNTEAGLMPTLYLWKNGDSGMTSTTQTQLRQLGNVKRSQISAENRELSLTIVPYLLNQVFNAGYEQVSSRKQMIDINYPAVSHYSFGWFAENVAGSVTNTITATYSLSLEIEFRGQY